MKEDFIHFLWEHRQLDTHKLHAKNGLPVRIFHPGTPNPYSGPDFFNAQIQIGEQLWAGNVEIHLKSSDWFVHGHETDPAYDNVILHVVWEYDVPVFNTRGYEIPVLEVKNFLPSELRQNLEEWKRENAVLKCYKHQPVLSSMEKVFFEEALYTERLQSKTAHILAALEKTQQDWEEVLYKMLLRYFGVRVNTENFERIAGRLPYAVFKKHVHNLTQLEALLFGTAGLLNTSFPVDGYQETLLREYRFLKEKYNLFAPEVSLQFGRTRPGAFPTIRLSQFAMLYHRNNLLFQRLIKENNMKEWEKLLHVPASAYWESHYRFGKTSKKIKKFTGKQFIRMLIVNVLAPMKFAYSRYYGQQETERLFETVRSLPPEKNRITKTFENAGIQINNALESQAYIQLFTYYCSHEKCFECRMGKQIFLK